MTGITNPFEQQVGKLYAAGRPYFHPAVIARIKIQLKLQTSVAHAVDVGCGTGQSSVALIEIADCISAFDPSEEMLKEAIRHEHVTYRQARAEELPLADNSCDLMTLASVLHWLDREPFLKEAHRTLTPGGHLIIYDHLFAGEMTGNPDYTKWHSNYLRAFPSPPRKREPFGPEQAEAASFTWETTERFKNPVEFTQESLTAYLLTQSNVATKPDKARDWLNTNIPTVFQNLSSAPFVFNAAIAYLQRR